jgi:ribonuclease BN (tRNA processing enzyme)
MKLMFLGSGGGRIVLMTQLRATGGFIVEMDSETLHVDPGPGALVRANQYHVSLRKLTGVLVSHTHSEHANDVDVVIESMTQGTHERKGILIGNVHVFKGGGKFRKVVSPFHLDLLERHEILEAGKTIDFKTLRITGTKTEHDDPECIGFLIRGKETLGYTSDTEYFEGLSKEFEGSDYLILNVLQPRGRTWKGHMNSEDAAKLVKEVKPKVAIIQHFGMIMLRANPFKEARWIEEQTGVKTIAARDGMRLDFEESERKGLEKWVK